MSSDLRIALFQPDIPGNTGTIIRTAACLGLGVDIIAPAGFDFSDRALKRSGMDYVELATVRRHDDWRAFESWRRDDGRRLLLFTTKGASPYTGFAFRPGDILLFGRESAGAPDHVHAAADARLLIPMAPGRRSLNLAVSAAMASSEAIRQLSA
ncbi:tRNA methyltransferase [Zhengella mangrovi]|uniref:tRNA (cytidine(34)-2'-O)-methyltransferase n=1 Tax=Zhengella mangrovi TaxID=1982044 RepID=A0A2G1QPD8_9HYPH|nr:tRNA (cytidine(34)-2'-O)-methyltransferase [Zhengella mangrovi]PHP67355.1 tRNA methyltransferase [Zhengella mangrovi]